MNSLHILCFLCLGFYNVACAPTQESFYEAIQKKCPSVNSISTYKDEHLFTMCKDWKAISTVDKFIGNNQIEIRCLLYFEAFTQYCMGLKVINTTVARDAVLKYDLKTVCNYAKSIPNDNLRSIFSNGDNCQKICGDELEWVKSLCGISYYFAHLKVISTTDPANKDAITAQGHSEGIVAAVNAVNQQNIPIPADSVLPAQVQGAPAAHKGKIDGNPVHNLEAAINQPDLLNGHINPADVHVMSPNPKDNISVNKSSKHIGSVADINAATVLQSAHHANDHNTSAVKAQSNINPGTQQKQLVEKKHGNENDNKPVNPGDEADQVNKDPKSAVKGNTEINIDLDNAAAQDQQLNGAEKHSTINNNGNDQNTDNMAEQNQVKQDDPVENVLDTNQGQDKIGDVEIDSIDEEGQPRPDAPEEEPDIVQKEKSDQSSKPLQVDEDSESVSYTTEMDGDSYFFTYFMLLCIIFIVGYVCYHNKQKILALILEGRRGKRQYRGGRRPNSANYHKLDSNLEEAITSTCKKNTNNVIY